MSARWDGDERGHGSGDAGQLVAGATELVAAFSEPGWVAEQPEVHLLPHVQAWTQQDQRLVLTGAGTDSTGGYVLDLEWQDVTDSAGSVGAVRAAVFALIGSFAETATYVRQRRIASSALRFEVGTGELASDARFSPHGHVVLITVSGGF